MSLCIISIVSDHQARETYIIGALMYNTACHSFQFRGTIENNPCKNGIYSRAKCNAMLREIAYTSIMLSQRGKVNKLSLLDSAFIALNISMTTNIDSETVEAALAWWLLNISHPSSGNAVEH